MRWTEFCGTLRFELLAVGEELRYSCAPTGTSFHSVCDAGPVKFQGAKAKSLVVLTKLGPPPTLVVNSCFVMLIYISSSFRELFLSDAFIFCSICQSYKIAVRVSLSHAPGRMRCTGENGRQARLDTCRSGSGAFLFRLQYSYWSRNMSISIICIALPLIRCLVIVGST
jgi:hypothetical protein